MRRPLSAWGLVAEVVPHERLLERAREIAAGVASIPQDNVREIRRMYDAIGALAGEAAWQAESDWSRRWMQDRFDQSRLATERENHHGPGPGPEHRAGQHAGVRVYAGMDPRLSLPDVVAHAQRVERLGYDGLHVAETVHDAMAVALLAAEHTARITVRTSVALAFTRSPTLLAYAAWDIAKLSGGRFQLGLGTQIRQNIEDRYGVAVRRGPDRPAPRLRRRGARRVRLVRVRAGAVLRERALPGHAAPALLQPRSRPRHRGAAASTWAVCSGAPVRWPGRWPTAS